MAWLQALLIFFLDKTPLKTYNSLHKQIVHKFCAKKDKEKFYEQFEVFSKFVGSCIVSSRLRNSSYNQCGQDRAGDCLPRTQHLLCSYSGNFAQVYGSCCNSASNCPSRAVYCRSWANGLQRSCPKSSSIHFSKVISARFFSIISTNYKKVFAF